MRSAVPCASRCSDKNRSTEYRRPRAERLDRECVGDKKKNSSRSNASFGKRGCRSYGREKKIYTLRVTRAREKTRNRKGTKTQFCELETVPRKNKLAQTVSRLVYLFKFFCVALNCRYERQSGEVYVRIYKQKTKRSELKEMCISIYTFLNG